MIPACHVNKLFSNIFFSNQCLPWGFGGYLAAWSAYRLEYVNQSRIIQEHSRVELEYLLYVPTNLGSRVVLLAGALQK